MTRVALRRPAIFSLVLFSAIVAASAARAQSASTSLSGAWTLNPALTKGPAEIGFNTNLVPEADDNERGGRSRRGVRPSPFMARPESADEASRLRELTDEARRPSPALTIADSAGEVVVTNGSGETRRFHPTGIAELIPLGETAVNVTASRNSGALEVVFDVQEGRQLRYTYSRSASPAQLRLEIEFSGRGGGDKVTYTYEPTAAHASPAAPGTSTAVSTHPGDEFKHLTTVGVVVDELSEEARACGLTQSGLEEAISKRLSDGGLKVRRYDDEAPYVYVQVVTTSAGNGLCVSRYDASLLTHTMATLNYQQAPVQVEISLLHKGGLTGGSPAAHSTTVTHGLLQYIDQFMSRIADANK